MTIKNKGKCESRNRLPHFFITILLLTITLTTYAQQPSDGEENESTRLEKLGHEHAMASRFEKAIEAWKSLTVKNMQRENIEEYALAYYYTGKHSEGLNIALQGLELFPQSPRLSRVAMMCCVELGAFDDALLYFQKLMGIANDSLYDTDYYYYARIYDSKNQYEEAIRHYKTAVSLTGDRSLVNHNAILKEMLQCYVSYTSSLIEKAQVSEGEARTSIYKKADKLYAELETLYPDATEFATFMRARVNAYLDPTLIGALALPHYQKIITLINPKTEKDEADIFRLSEAYLYMISYYTNIKNDSATAKDYAMKLYEIDPENPIAKKLLDL